LLTLPAVFVYAKEPPDTCVLCQGKLKVRKSFTHGGKTIKHGTFRVCETVWECADGCSYPSGVKVTRRAEAVVGSILPGRTVGYDVMIFIGLKRYLEYWRRDQIRTALRDEHGILLSTGEVSNLTKRFVEYLGRLHRRRAGQLKAALMSDGGWPMHVDATGENGRGTIYAVMACCRPWILGAWKIATERADLILPCLHETVGLFGTPCAAVRDLGKAVTPALKDFVKELSLDIPVLGCHQHFAADIGKDLLEPSHAELRELFRRTGMRADLRRLARDLGRTLGEQIEQGRQAAREWQSRADDGHRVPDGLDGLAVVRTMTQWTLDFPAQATGLDFPYDRPYLDLYDRCLVALRATDAFLRNPPKDRRVARALGRLHRALQPVDSEVPFLRITKRLRSRARLFDELRDVLRLAAGPPEDETAEGLDTMHEALDALVVSLRARRPERGPAQDTREAIDLIIEHIDRHGESLWGHAIRLPESIGGGVRLVERTNNRIENLFKGTKHDERQRSGRKNLTQDLEHFPAEALLVRNLKCPDYVSIVCGSLDRLDEAFAELDQDDRERELKCLPPREQITSNVVLQIGSSSLPTADRRLVRTEEMDRRMKSAASSRAPHR
jgi:hypothetical protein